MLAKGVTASFLFHEQVLALRQDEDSISRRLMPVIAIAGFCGT